MKEHINRRALVLILVCAVLLGTVILFLAGRYHSVSGENRDLRAELAQKEEELEKLREKEEAPASTPVPAAVETPSPAPTEAPSYIGDLENVEAGTIVAEEEIDREHLEPYFASYEISDALFGRIYGDDRSFKTYCTVPREDLRYIKVLHYGFDQQIHVGELMVNYLLAEDMTSIFQSLFENRYEIEKMYLIDNYDADDDLSCNENNTSCFNFRLVTGGSTLSNHATGCAIDINPRNNPYVTIDGDGIKHWENVDAELYIDRTNPDAAAMHMITHEDLCYQLFAERGYTWGGDWANPIDYQHFEKVVY